MAHSQYEARAGLEPRKYNPTDPAQRTARDDAFLPYQSISTANPFDAGSRLQKPHILLSPEVGHHEVWVVNHPALQAQASPSLYKGHPGVLGPPIEFSSSTSANGNSHSRTNSLPSPKIGFSEGFRKPGRSVHAFSKSVSESSVLRPKSSSPSISEDGSSERKRKVTPLHLPILRPRSPSKQHLNTIDEQDDAAKDYKVEVQDPGSEVKQVRSPLKKLFGEGGMLGKSTSAKDFSDSGSKKSGIAHWGGKVKARVEDMTKDISDRIQTFEASQSHKRNPSGASTFPVSLSPYVQGDFYMQLELLLNIESNNFIMHEYNMGRISITSIRTVTETWRNKGRPQVLGFRYDLASQRELVGLNTDTVRFSGINAFSRQRLVAVLASWKVLAREIAIRTFCQPDSAVKKHLHDAEKVLEIINASSDSMLAFQEMRSRVVTEIYKEERLEAEKKYLNGVKRP